MRGDHSSPAHDLRQRLQERLKDRHVVSHACQRLFVGLPLGSGPACRVKSTEATFATNGSLKVMTAR
jgi:hypothetical protein